jgi:predicted dithiol-disulfide oxidoreductase (DUF899 family)
MCPQSTYVFVVSFEGAFPLYFIVTSMNALAGLATSMMRALTDSKGCSNLSLSNTFHLMNNIELEHPTIVTQNEWLVARKAHLEREKSLTRFRDQVSAERRELPWVKIEKNYVFDTPNGKETLAGLFDGRSQLIVYHFMLGPSVRDGREGCESCSFLVDHVDGANVYLAHHDVTFVAVSRTPLSQIESFKNRMGWQFKWVSSQGSDFNYDFHVSATKDELAKGRVYYNYEVVEFRCEEQPGLAFSTRTRPGISFTPIPHTGAEATS